MATIAFQPVPTYADPVLTSRDSKTGQDKSEFNPVWLQWFLQLTQGGLGATVQHDSLAGLQGGASGEYYHLTLAQYLSVNYRNNGSVVAVPPSISPQLVVNGNFYDIDLIYSGGTISLVEFSRDNATFYPVGAGVGFVTLSPGDTARLTFGGVPSFVEVPR